MAVKSGPADKEYRKTKDIRHKIHEKHSWLRFIRP